MAGGRTSAVAIVDYGSCELAGFAPAIDRHDIKPGEPWEDRLGGLIAQSDTVVFVITLAAVKSERCTWEVERP